MFSGWIKKIFLYIEKKGSYDNYVPLGFPRFRFLTNRDFIQKIRIRMWTKIAKNYEPFAPFYCHEKRNSFIEKISNIHIKDFYMQGTAVIPNALSSDAVERINALVEKMDFSKDTETNYHQLDLRQVEPDLCQELLVALKPFYNTLFPDIDIEDRFERLGTVQLRVDFSVSGEDFGIATANWHPDRFVPTLNAIWFPLGANWGAFEKDVGDPIITDADIQSYIKYRDLNNGTSELRDNAYVDLGREKRKIIVEKNSLVVGSHHLQHRRGPFNGPGKRIGVFIDNYNIFGRGDLL